MTEQDVQAFYQKIDQGVKTAVAQAIERHRRLGEAIAVWRDGRVVILQADEIPPMQVERSDTSL
jgi:hypothetical protein